jgi:hypothetical protein
MGAAGGLKMKNWFLMLTFAFLSMFAVACLSNIDPTDDGSDDQVVETSTTESELTYSCSLRCSQEYNSCITGDPFDDCLCKNAWSSCRRSCGLLAGPLTQCWP